MKIFIDSANTNEIKEAASWGILDGVTTNPSLASKEDKDFKELIWEICEIVKGPVSAEVVSVDREGMLREGRELKKIHPHVVVKVPLTTEGLKAAKILSCEEIPVNVTLCFSATQALLAAKVGAAYISPFIGRLDDVSEIGMNLIRDIKTIYKNYNFKTQILAASLRHPIHLLEAALIGADAATAPFRVIEQLVKHPLTEVGLARFLSDWERGKSQIGSKAVAGKH